MGDRRIEAATDVVVVGFGYAGARAAIAAHDAGAKVTLIERAPRPGGISVCSVGSLRCTDDPDAAFAYLKTTCGGKTPDPVLRALADGMAGLADDVAALCAGSGAELTYRRSPGNYPFPGHEAFGFVYVEALPGFDRATALPRVSGSDQGAMLFHIMRGNVAARGIDVRVSTRATRLLRDASGAISGVAIESPDGAGQIEARRAVVLACGGFESAPEMQDQFWPGGSAFSAAYRYNTGDGIRMAQAVGADLWHMWHFHGAYGYRHPDPAYPFAIRVKRLPDWVPGADRQLPSMAWILLDGGGRRFMNEYEPYVQDTGARPFAHYDPATQSYPRIPAWLIVDEAGRAAYPLGKPTFNDPDVDMTWSDDNLREVELGIFTRAPTLAGLAEHMQVAPDALAASVARWNANCGQGADPDFGRPSTSMQPIATPPFYAAQVWPVISNTQGGPVHDANQAVLTPDARPIGRLYAAGELGSAFGHLYLSGGNLAECFVGGRTAGRNAAAEQPR